MKDKISVKTAITLVGLALWIFFCIYGAFCGQFDNVFEFFKTQFAVIVAFFFGMKYQKESN